MTRRIYVGLLFIEALACVMFYILRASFDGVFSVAMAFPFEQIGMGLRSLSLSSGIGNVVAVVAYFAVSLLPIVYLLALLKKRKLHAEDGILVLLSAVIFAVLYIMVNPGLIDAWLSDAAQLSFGKAVLGSVAYSVLCGYLILRALRLFSGGGTEKLVRYISTMLHLLNVLFVYFVFGAHFGELLDTISAFQAGNTGREHALGVSYFFLVLQFVVDVLPYAFDILIVFAALRLLDEMRMDRYSIETVASAEQIARLCKVALVATTLGNIGFNLLQLIYAKSLAIINSSVQIPVFSITFVLTALLVTRLITENKRLQDDNDMFI